GHCTRSAGPLPQGCSGRSGKLSDPCRVRTLRARMAKTDSQLEGERILLCVCGGIAAYKSADLVRRLRDAGAQVRVAMTEGATHFVGATTFQALSGESVRGSLWDPAAEAAMGHIELARWATRVLVAPATANTLAKLANGFADNLVTTLCLATTAPLALAP